MKTRLTFDINSAPPTQEDLRQAIALAKQKDKRKMLYIIILLISCIATLFIGLNQIASGDGISPPHSMWFYITAIVFVLMLILFFMLPAYIVDWIYNSYGHEFREIELNGGRRGSHLYENVRKILELDNIAERDELVRSYLKEIRFQGRMPTHGEYEMIINGGSLREAQAIVKAWGRKQGA